MGTYAVRALSKDGRATRRVFEAPDPVAALRIARDQPDHPVMIYVLRDKPRRHFHRLWVASDTPVPPVIRGRKALREWEVWPYQASATEMRAAMAEWGVRGRIGWFSSEVEIPGVIAAGMRFLRRALIEGLFERFEAPAVPSPPAAQDFRPHTGFENLPLIAVDPRQLILRPSARLLQSKIHGLVISEAEDEVIVLAEGMPDAVDCESLETAVGRRIRFGRASMDFEENLSILKEIYNRNKEVISVDFDEKLEIGFGTLAWYEPSDREWDSGEPWEGESSGLPSLPIESFDSYGSRLHTFFEDANPLAKDVQESPLWKL